jgi:hypothetical protein
LTQSLGQPCEFYLLGAEEEAVLRSELKHTHSAAYRTEVYEGAMLRTAGPRRMVHLAPVVKQREFFLAECRRKAETGEAGGLGEKMAAKPKAARM